MKRVLHLFGKMDCGGAETMIMNIYRKIDREKVHFDFLVCSCGKGYYDNEIEALGGNIFYIGSQGSLGIPKYIHTLESFFRKHNMYDTIHSHLDWQGGAIAYAAHMAGIKRIIVHAHTYSNMKTGFLFHRVLDIQKYWINKYATDFWACSAEAGNFLFKCNKNIKIIPNAINLKQYLSPDNNVVQALRDNVGAMPETMVIGHIGSFSVVKNQKFLIDIAKKLSAEGLNFKMVLVGNNANAYGTDVKKYVVENNLSDHIFCLGLRNDIYNVVNAFDIFCFPSLFEGLGIAAIEAQAAGIPCIVSNNVSESVDMGLSLVSRLSLNSIEKWGKCIIENKNFKKVDKQTIKQLIREKNFDIEQSVKFIEQLYLD